MIAPLTFGERSPRGVRISGPVSVWVKGERQFRMTVMIECTGGLLHRFYGATPDEAEAKAWAFIEDESARQATAEANKYKRRAGRIRQAAAKRALKASARGQAP